jgi:hypothetical protein
MRHRRRLILKVARDLLAAARRRKDRSYQQQSAHEYG